MLWIARLCWFLLPLTVGRVVTDAVGSWSTGPAVTLAVLAYAVWTSGAIALLAPRPRSFTALRLAAGAPLVLVVASAFHAADAMWLVGFVHAIVTPFLVLGSSVHHACIDAESYGTEQRFAMRTPPAFVAIASLAAAAFLAGIASGPLLLADGRWAVGAVATIAGFALAFVVTRAMHTLTRRFFVLVPAGVVIADAIGLVDPVLLPREHVVALRHAGVQDRPDALDLRLGAYVGAVAFDLDEAVDVPVRRGRTESAAHRTASITATPVRGAAFLAAAGTHDLHVLSAG